MAIHHVTFSTIGGAGVVASLLVQGQQDAGLDSVLHTQTEKNLWEEPFRYPLLTLKSAIDHFVISNRSQPSQFSLMRRGLVDDVFDAVKPQDILHLHWVTGMVIPEQLLDVSKNIKKIVWTLHDMEPFTGGCHHAGSCRQYAGGCLTCPQVRTPFRNPVKNNFETKVEVLSQINNLELVVPSHWMAKNAKSSQVFKGRPISVIENPISESFFSAPYNNSYVRSELGIPEESFVAIFIAEDLDNPNKQIHQTLMEFLNSTGDPKLRHVILVGRTKIDYGKDQRITVTGPVSSKQLSKYVCAANIHISMSLAESAGLTIAETAAIGVMSIVRSGSGMSDMLVNGETGCIVNDHEELKVLVRELSQDLQKVERLSAKAKSLADKKFRIAQITQKYLEIYNR